MAYIPIEKLLKDKTSLFKLVMTAARRCTELSQGSAPLVATASKKVTTIALEEIVQSKVWYEVCEKGESKDTAKEKGGEKKS